ncbi:MAG: hypothetical protein JNJ57_08420, partial [Saprospiraceae bacterium]|nr:hypothetical protein [Saprospiraceae bacterium]
LEKYRERRHEEEVRAEAVRLEAEKKEAEAMREAAEARAREEEQKRKVSESQRRKANLLSIAAVLGFLLAIGVGWWALEQKEVADAARNEAEQQREKTQKALDQYLEEQKAREKLATDNLLGTIQRLENSGDLDLAIRRLEEARAGGNADPRIELKISELKIRKK